MLIFDTLFGLLIVRPESGMFFANAEHVRRTIRATEDESQLTVYPTVQAAVDALSDDS